MTLGHAKLVLDHLRHLVVPRQPRFEAVSVSVAGQRLAREPPQDPSRRVAVVRGIGGRPPHLAHDHVDPPDGGILPRPVRGFRVAEPNGRGDLRPGRDP